jgi:hypothetical protein
VFDYRIIPTIISNHQNRRGNRFKGIQIRNKFNQERGGRENVMGKEIKNTVIPDQIVEIWQRLVDSISDLLSVPSVMINRLNPNELEVFRSK